MTGEDAVTYRADYSLPGSFFNEDASRTLDAYDPDEAVSKAPANAFCFTLCEVPIPPDLGPEFTVIPKPRRRSGRYYIGGTVHTLAEVQAMTAGVGVLADNMRANRWDHAIRCRTGNWQPFEDDDTLLPEPVVSGSTVGVDRG